eukprot:Nitzschia sp. Nitz4//scaffold103_size77763//8612//9301//NITZ4_005438-RA/size77763-processed-gene-0.1-mRNA-1//1//CDS//3329532307//3846//frame0
MMIPSLTTAVRASPGLVALATSRATATSSKSVLCRRISFLTARSAATTCHVCTVCCTCKRSKNTIASASNQAHFLPANANQQSTRCFSMLGDWSTLYKIEANNAAREGATQLTVVGPDVDGILASMTVALATQDCSLVELHAAKSVDTSSYHYAPEDQIHDIFLVVNRHTGEPFPDDELEGLALSLLESLKTPMVTLGRSGMGSAVAAGEEIDIASQITIVPSTSADSA